MKQCKVCGTLVHIDSNTCPSCGNHNFFVLDVKICPLCGKVNNITSSFCEQCGKQFVTAQGASPYINKLPPRNPVYRDRQPQKRAEQEKDYQIEKPLNAVKPLSIEENAAERAYKDFMALKPEVAEKEDCSEYSYYVKGDANKLPVIILPKFAKTQGKNILVNIVVNSGDNNAKSDINMHSNKPEATLPSDNTAAYNYQDDSKIITADNLVKTEVDDKVFTPYSAIGGDDKEDTNQAFQAELNEQVINETSEDENEIFNNIKETKVKSKKIKKQRLSGKAVISSLILMLTMLGLIASFMLVFYTSDNPAYRSAGISPVLYALKDLFNIDIFLPVAFENGFINYHGNYGTGQFVHFAHLVPYIFLAVPVLSLINLFVIMFTFKHKVWAKILLIATTLLTGLCLAAVGLAMKFVYNSGAFATLGLGLIIACVVAALNFILVIAAYKPNKD